jgi:hypothetical protein
MQEILCTERILSCNTAVMSSVDGHYEQTFSEVVNSTREDGQSCLLTLDVLIMKNITDLFSLCKVKAVPAVKKLGCRCSRWK